MKQNRKSNSFLFLIKGYCLISSPNVSNICQKAREQGYTVLLGGTAGDDLFSGYRRHQSLFYIKKLNHILP